MNQETLANRPKANISQKIQPMKIEGTDDVKVEPRPKVLNNQDRKQSHYFLALNPGTFIDQILN